MRYADAYAHGGYMTGIILDIAVVVITVLLLIFGIWRGMYKLIFGLVSALLAIVLAVICVSPVSTFIVDKTTLDERLSSAIDKPLSTALPNGDVVIQLLDLDGDGNASELGFVMDGEQHPFADLLEGTPYSMLSSVVESAVKGRVTEESSEVTFRAALVASITAYIIMAIVFILLLIIFSILVALIMKLIKKFVTHTYLGHFIDKLLGAVLGLAIAAVIIFGALAIIRMLGTYEWIIPVNNLIESSTLTKILYNNNYLYTFIVDMVDIQGLIDKIMSSFGGTTSTAESTDGSETQQAIGMLKNLVLSK